MPPAPDDEANGRFVITYVTGVQEHAARYRFHTVERLQLWNHTVLDIKNHIAWINEENEPETRPLLYPAWMEKVERFHGTFGSAWVPLDIKWALNNVEEGEGVPMTVW